MIRVKRFVIQRAVVFITNFEEDFPSVTNTVFMRSFPRFSMTSLRGYRNFSVLCTCHVYILFLSMFFFFFNLDSVCGCELNILMFLTYSWGTE